MQIELDAAGIQKTKTDLLRFSENVVNPLPVLRRIGMRMEGEIEAQFATEGRRFNRPWKPLQEATIARKRALGYSSEMLVATGKLKQSFREDGPNNYFLLEPDEVAVGSTDPIALFHQKGTKAGLPARPIVVMTRAFRTECVKRIQRFIVTGEVDHR